MRNEQAVAGKKRLTAAEIEHIVREFENSGLNRSQSCRQQGFNSGSAESLLAAAGWPEEAAVLRDGNVSLAESPHFFHLVLSSSSPAASAGVTSGLRPRRESHAMMRRYFARVVAVYNSV
jgi:hypothetical protein